MPKLLEPTPEIIDDVCTRIMNGQSLVQICKQKHLPSYPTIMRWARDNDSFRERYARAREDQGHTIYAEIQDIEDKVASGEMNPNQGRVLIDSKKWRAARMHGKYNEKIVVKQDVKQDMSIRWEDPTYDTTPEDAA